LVVAGPAPQNAQEAPAPAQIAGQAGVAPAHPMPEPLLAQALVPEAAPEAAPGLAPNDDAEGSPLNGSLRGFGHILLPGDEGNA